MKPTSSGYADVNGIKLYHEIYGGGEPVVLIHGGLTTIGEMQPWVHCTQMETKGACLSLGG
jgi:pimeloyl-ACP methyl ester carboxylesterase